MRSDGWMLWYLLNRKRREPNGVNPLAFWFDWVNDFISSNATIGRTGYDMNVSGNVTTGSDGDGDYFWFTLTPQSLLVTTTAIPALTLASTFSYAIKIKTWSDVTTLQTIHNNIISTSNRVALSIASWELRVWIYNWTSYVGKKSFSVTTNTTYVIHYTRDWSSAWKLYLAWVEQTNVPVWDPSASWTVWFSLSRAWSWFLWQVYFFAWWNKALTQAEIDADIALWNTTKQDPSIVAYYVPENLQFNTQYMSYPTDLSDSNWNKWSWTVVTSNTSTAPDWTTTADNVTWTWTNTTVSALYQNNTSITWSTIASKTFIVKAFCRTTAWTQLFRLNMTHPNVAAYFSSNLTATTARQEFTFTQTFTSSTSWTWVQWGITCPTTNIAWSLEVRNVRVYLTNQTLRDESPNIWWYIGRKTPLVMSARVKLWTDAVDTVSSQVIFKAPRHYLHLRWTTNVVNRRSETTLQARIAWTAWTAILWTWNRNKVHILGVKWRDWTGWLYKAYVNGVQTSWAQSAYSTTIRPSSTIYTTQLLVWKDSTASYYNWNIRDARIYTFTWSFTGADALAIYNWWEPTSAWVTKYLHYRPPVGEVWTTTQDQSSNDRDWTLNGGVTRIYL